MPPSKAFYDYPVPLWATQAAPQKLLCPRAILTSRHAQHIPSMESSPHP